MIPRNDSRRPSPASRTAAVLAVLGAALASVAPGTAASGREVVLAASGAPRAGVVIVPGASEAERLAAGELSHFLAMLGGAPVPVVESPGKIPEGHHRIALGLGTLDLLPAAERGWLEAGASRLEETEVAVVTRGEVTLLAGGSPRALLDAVYTFLHDLGCRWYFPGPLGEVIPRKERVTWEVRDLREKPAFRWRRLYAENAPEGDAWARRNRANSFAAAPGISGVSAFGGHALEALIPPAKYFDEHPEYFSLINEKRQWRGGQLCFSSSAVQALVLEKCRASFDADPRLLSFSLAPNDVAGFCTCPSCLALGPTVSDQVFRFTDTVARTAGRTHAGRLINNYAYAEYTEPPATLERLAPNVAVIICRIGSWGCMLHPLTAREEICPYNARARRMVEGWTEKARHILFYDYLVGHYEWLAPLRVTEVLAADLRFEASLPAVEGLVPEMHMSWATQGLNGYVFARLAWDPWQDVAALEAAWFRDLFGPAEPEVRRYFERAWEGVASLGHLWGDRPALAQAFTPERLEAMEAALEAARKAAGSGAERDRVALLADGFRFTRAQAARYRARGEGDLEGEAAAIAGLEKVAATIPSWHVQHWLPARTWAGEREYLAGRVELLRRALAAAGVEAGERVPRIDWSFVTDWHVAGPFPNDGHGALDVAYGPEESLDLGARYSTRYGEVAWRKVPPAPREDPEPFAVDLRRLFRPRHEYVCAYLAAFVDSPESQEVLAILGTDDGGKLWVNGELRWRLEAIRGYEPFGDVVPVTLRAGRNLLLLKVTQAHGRWKASLALEARRPEGGILRPAAVRAGRR